MFSLFKCLLLANSSCAVTGAVGEKYGCSFGSVDLELPFIDVFM
jgi:hypothetical protein